MTSEELFSLGLGLPRPWFVSSSRIEDGVLHIEIDFESGSKFSGLRVHDTEVRTWQHLNFWQYRTLLHARVPRLMGPDGKVRMADVPWARPGSGFTALFEALALAMMRSMPVSAVARHLQVDDMRLWRLLEVLVNAARDRARYADVRRVGVDETAARRGHDYISLFVDLDRGRVLFACRGKGPGTVEAFVNDLKRHGGDPREITTFSCDMGPSFLLGIARHFPKAKVVLDKFHLVRQLQDAVDETRRKETTKRAPVGTRFLLLKNPANLGEEETARLERLLATEAFVKTSEAYRLRLAFQELFVHTKDRAGIYLDAWTKAALNSGVAPVKRVARSFAKHRDKILAWFDEQVSNGILEGLNGVLQSVKARARGYANPNHMILMSYLLHGKLELTHETIRTVRRTKQMSARSTHTI